MKEATTILSLTEKRRRKSREERGLKVTSPKKRKTFLDVSFSHRYRGKGS